MATSMADLGFNIDSSPMRRATGELDKMSKGAGRAEKATAGLASAANVARIAIASLSAVAGGLGVSRLIRETTDFDSALRRLQATSQATGDQMAQLEKQARTLGATTIFSAKETADAQQFLAMAGFEVNKIMAATPSVLKLATAANMGLAQAADIASNVLGGMRLEVSQLDRVIDVMASTTSGSNTNIQQLGTALAYAAPLAASAGIEIEEVAAAIGTLSDAGVQGSRAGTGLVGVIRQLSNVTPDAQKALDRYGITLSEVDITTRGLAPVLRTLREANISTSDAFKVFGSEAGAAAQILASGSERVREFTEELSSAEGSAEAMARTIGGGLAGSWASFNSALSETIIRLGRDEGVAGGFQNVTDAATGILSVYNGMLPQFAEANDLTEDQVEALESQAAMLKAVAFGLGAVATVYGTVAVATRAATVAQVAFNLAARANPYLLIASSVAAAAAAIYSFTGAQESALEVWERAKESEAAYQAALGDVGAANRIQEIAAERIELQERLNEAQGRWIRNGTEEAAIKQQLAELETEYHQITNARIEAEKAASDRRKEAREAEAEALKLQAELQQQQQAAAEAAAKAERDAAIDQIDLLRERLGLLKEGTVEFRRNMETVREAVALGIITKDQAAQIVQAMTDAAEESGEEFVNQWQSAADRVAQSLQDAIASGDWDKLGDAIGNALAASIAGIVNKTITDSLAKDLTANSSTLAQIGGAFAGPIAGAVAGGIVQGVMDSLFGSDPFIDPTEARQATQLTNTVLGSINDKSESTASASEITADNTGELINVNRELIGAIRGIDVASEALVEGISEIVRGFTSGFLAKNLGDAGFVVDGTLGDLGIRQFREAGIFGKGDAIKLELPVDAGISEALGAAVASTASLVVESVSTLGLGTEGLADRIGNIQVDFGKLSFEGMSSEEVEKEIGSLLSEIMDISAQEVAPFVSDFQRLGEGAGETLVRLASQFTVFEESVESLSLSFSGNTISASDELVRLAGGLDEFRSSIVSFERNFLSDADQFANTSRRLTEAMGDLPIPETREGFLELARAQDLSTASGRENFATILELQGTANEYYSAIEKAQESYYQTEIAGQRERLNEAQRANRAVQSAMDAMLFQSSAVQEASRQGALRTLEQIANAGRVTNLGQLQSALDAATQIDAGNYSTFADYAREFARTSGVVGRVGDVTQQAEDREARMLRSLENQLEAVKGLRDDLERSQLAIIKQANKTAKILERFEIDGIEVRA